MHDMPYDADLILTEQEPGRLTIAALMPCHEGIAEAIAETLIRVADDNRRALESASPAFSKMHSAEHRKDLANYINRVLARAFCRHFGIKVPDVYEHLTRLEGPALPEGLQEHIDWNGDTMIAVTVDYGAFDQICAHADPDMAYKPYVSKIIKVAGFPGPSSNSHIHIQ